MIDCAGRTSSEHALKRNSGGGGGGTHVEGDVDDPAEDVGRHGGCRRPSSSVAEVLEVALREVHDDAPLARRGRDGPRARVPQLEAHPAGRPRLLLLLLLVLVRRRRRRGRGAGLAVVGQRQGRGRGLGLGLGLEGAVASSPRRHLRGRRLLLVLLHRVEVDPRHGRQDAAAANCPRKRARSTRMVDRWSEVKNEAGGRGRGSWLGRRGGARHGGNGSHEWGLWRWGCCDAGDY
jgi:hypothetical protein